ncbi:MAG: DUF3795 domain-containing protein [Patescibacteria group bacterium]
MDQKTFSAKMIAPCGMNCGACKGHLRAKNPCPGCRFLGNSAPKTRAFCPIKLCKKRTGAFCCTCPSFPCALLQRLDARYRERYGMSEIENLKFIKKHGVEKFLRKEEKERVSCKGVRCVHDGRWYEGEGLRS